MVFFSCEMAEYTTRKARFVVCEGEAQIVHFDPVESATIRIRTHIHIRHAHLHIYTHRYSRNSYRASLMSTHLIQCVPHEGSHPVRDIWRIKCSEVKGFKPLGLLVYRLSLPPDTPIIINHNKGIDTLDKSYIRSKSKIME